MEKLKAKHDHKLTDILKVAIFGLMLILPGLILLPSMLYYGVNEYATAPTEQVEKIEYKRIDFNQIVPTQNYNFDYLGVTIESNNDGKYILNGTAQDNIGFNVGSYNFLKDHTYIYTGLDSFSNDYSSLGYLTYNYNGNQLYTFTDNVTVYYVYYLSNGNTYNNLIFYPQIFDLTQMFGKGNEPTLQEFNSWFTEEYYNYTTSEYQILEIPTGTYETYTDITSQIQYNWNSLWQQPLFNWTNYTIVKQGIDNFTGVFGITNTSNLSNLIAYELIIVAIYIVIDIVLTLFKWLTHLIGEK